MKQSKHNNMLLTHLPDMSVSLDSEHFLCSSAGDFSQERLEFFANNIYPYWADNRCSLHQLASYLEQFDIELWTAPDVKITKKMEFAFDIVFKNEYPGSVLVQCELYRKESIH